MNNTGFLQSSPGNASSMRLAFLLIVVVSLFLTTMMVIKDRDILDTMTLFTTMIASAITLKTVQTSQENKANRVAGMASNSIV